MIRRSALLAITALLIAHADTAMAAPVLPTARPLGSAHVSVSSCGSLAGITVSWTSSADVVTAVSLASIPAACTGASLSVTLVGAGNVGLTSSSPATVTGTALVLTSFTGSATTTSVTGAYLSAVGP
jgi:hypothetical protein